MRLAQEKREGFLYTHLYQHVHVVVFEWGALSFRFSPDINKKDQGRFVKALENFLQEHTNCPWKITVCEEEGGLSYHQQQEQKKKDREKSYLADPLVQKAHALFPSLVLDHSLINGSKP